MTTATQTPSRYIATRNEIELQRRRALLVKNWTDRAARGDPLTGAVGHQEVGALIESVQQRFPGFRLILRNRVDHCRDKVGPPI